MTPARAKRNSKAPNRFSSDNSRIETSNASGETIIDYNDKTTSTTHSLAPISRAIKLKPALREPLKVKLPKLKRPHVQQTKEPNVNRGDDNQMRIHKIKLPSFSKKSSKNLTDSSDSKSKPSKSSTKAGPKLDKTTSFTDSRTSSDVPSPSSTTAICGQNVKSQVDYMNLPAPSELNVSTASKSSEGDQTSSSANVSLSSDGACDTKSHMEIVIQSDPSNSSGIRCPCGVNVDLSFMVECENCSTWQHGHCINIGGEEEAYEGYICAYCTLPQDKVRESLCQLTVDDKFQYRFKLLESLRKQANTSDSMQPSSCNDTAENDAHLTVEELNQATKELHRVLISLKAKWKLLNGPYHPDLSIWQNPYWSEEPCSDKGKNFYFVDEYKNNLKLNISNMIKKMEERCQLIEYALSLSKFGGRQHDSDESSQELKLKRIRQSLEDVTNGVKEVKSRLKHLPN